MIWIDIGTPKYAMFFSQMIGELQKRGHDVVITTRYSPNYTEPKEILELNGIEHITLGNYGGNSLRDKFISRLLRQRELVELFDKIGTPECLICGAVVDSVQTAYGLGIPVVNIYDTPALSYPKDPTNKQYVTPVAKLTLPYSKLFFYPFVLPESIFENLGLADSKLIPYDFIDVCLWMDKIEKKEKNDFRKNYNIDTKKYTIAIREEEYKAHYVKEKIPLLYDFIYKIHEELDVNIVILPRYEKDYLKRDFGEIATVLEHKLKPEEFYPFIDLFIGGGGTMNLEAVYYGVPTISTRSIWLYHDKYLMENGLMDWVDNVGDGVEVIRQRLGTKVDSKPFFCKGECSFDMIIEEIEKIL